MVIEFLHAFYKYTPQVPVIDEIFFIVTVFY